MDPIYISITLFIVGITLAFLDLFIPSGAVLLIIGTVSALGSILFAFRVSQGFGMLMLTMTLATAPVLLFLAIKVWPHTAIGRRVILRLPSSDTSTGQSHALDDEFPVGYVFATDAPLLPSGAIRVGGKTLSVVAESGSIHTGDHILVVARRGREFVVRKTDAPITPLKKSRETTAQSDRDAFLGEPTEDHDLLGTAAEDLGIESLDDEVK